MTQNAGEVTRWAISQVRPLPYFVDRRVALLGDSVRTFRRWDVKILTH